MFVLVGMSRCRHITSKLTAVLQMERKLGVLSNSSVSGAESGTEKMRSRQQHSLFTRANTAASNAANSGANFDVEAVKLHHGRWGQILGISQPIYIVFNLLLVGRSGSTTSTGSRARDRASAARRASVITNK